MRVCFLAVSTMTNEPRVIREATALTQCGNEVIAIGARIAGDEPETERATSYVIWRVGLWHYALARQIKRLLRRRRNVALGDNGTRLDAAEPGLRRSVKAQIIVLLRQMQFVVDLVTVFCALFVAGFRARADVYHAHDYSTLPPALLLGKLLRRPVIYDSHEYWFNERRNEPLSNWLIRTIEKRGIPHCAVSFVVNSAIADRVAKNYGITRPTVLMNLPLFVDIPEPSASPHNGALRVLYHGIYARGRGVEHLIAAMSHVTADVTLTLRGYGVLEDELRALAKSLNLDDKVHFAPVVSFNKLIQSGTDCDIGALPFERQSTFFLSLPNKLFEYMASGLAIVTNALPEISSVVAKHGIGVTYSSEDPIKIAELLNSMARDRQRIMEFRMNAWTAFREQYNWDKNKSVLLDAYRALTKDQGPT